jgi:hypothetical protein
MKATTDEVNARCYGKVFPSPCGVRVMKVLSPNWIGKHYQVSVPLRGKGNESPRLGELTGRGFQRSNRRMLLNGFILPLKLAEKRINLLLKPSSHPQSTHVHEIMRFSRFQGDASMPYLSTVKPFDLRLSMLLSFR